MSREHLYKAKRKNWRELPKEKWWVEGNLLISDENCYIIPDFGVSCVEKLDRYVYVCDKLITLHAFEVEEDTVCEYAGLPDKNGRKIFEGDIVDSDGDVGIVKFGKYKNGFHFGYYIEWNKCPLLRQELGYWNGISKVIGNIFDNPELIRGKGE